MSLEETVDFLAVHAPESLWKNMRVQDYAIKLGYPSGMWGKVSNEQMEYVRCLMRYEWAQTMLKARSVVIV